MCRCKLQKWYLPILPLYFQSLSVHSQIRLLRGLGSTVILRSYINFCCSHLRKSFSFACEFTASHSFRSPSQSNSHHDQASVASLTSKRCGFFGITYDMFVSEFVRWCWFVEIDNLPLIYEVSDLVERVVSQETETT